MLIIDAGFESNVLRSSRPSPNTFKRERNFVILYSAVLGKINFDEIEDRLIKCIHEEVDRINSKGAPNPPPSPEVVFL